jgi:hypothetical protein
MVFDHVAERRDRRFTAFKQAARAKATCSQFTASRHLRFFAVKLVRQERKAGSILGSRRKKRA